ncbi:MAG: nicotinate-nucleotide adenylyltransferase [Candidatus Binatia bacterium]
MKIGLFGGTFDPIHWGHLRSAEEVREIFSLDRVLFVPASDPPHKRRKPTTSAQDRFEMVRLAVAQNHGFGVSSVELSRPGKSYSIDTIRYFAQKESARRSLYFILGLDAFREIDSWKEVQDIFPLCHLIVTSRPGCGGSMSLRTMPVAVRRGFCYDPRKKRYRHKSGKHLFFARLTDIAISSSEIRHRLGDGRSIRYLVPLEVETYIEKKGLYRRHQEGQSQD